MRVLITGGAGFVGSHLAEAYLQRGEDVWVLDDLSTGGIQNIEHLKGHERFHYVIDTVMNVPVLAECIDRCDIVVHLAAAVKRQVSIPVVAVGRIKRPEMAEAILRDHHDAEDVTQEVFLRVLRLRREMEGVKSPKTWLARIAFRVALDRRPRRGRLSLDDESLAADVASLRAAGAGADELAASKQVQELLGRAVAALPPDLRHAVQLSTLEELNSAEISALLGIPEGTVRTRLMRARALLREALAPALGARHD